MNAFRCILVTLLLLLGLARPSAMAANHIQAKLVAQTEAPAAGRSMTLAIVFTPNPGWHGYWKNPGDAGFGARFDWTLPKGVTKGEPLYPVPERLVISGLMNHVYEHEYALLVQLFVPRGTPAGTSLPIRVTGDWLACTNEICVPEQGELAIDLKVGDGAITPGRQAQFDGWWAKLPRPLDQAGRFEVSGKTLRIAVPFPARAPATNPWFYAETEQAVKYATPQKATRQGDELIIETESAGAVDDLNGVLAIGMDQGLAIRAKPGKVAAGGDALGQESEGGFATLWLALSGAILGGLLLNIMPCVFPIISLKALSLARAGGCERAAKREALAYSAGVIVTCLALGGLLLGLRAAGVAVGWAFQLQSPWVVGLLLILAISIMANLAGLFHLRAFGGGQALAGQGGTKGAFWTGALAAFVATPCTGPFMAAALGAALVLPVVAALAIFAGLGFGLALPFLAIGFIPALRKRMPRPGAWMGTFQRVLAVPMGLTAAALAWLLWRQLSPDPMLMPGNAISTSEGVLYSDEQLAALRKDGKPVFLYFTADWCLTCKANEKAAIESEEVKAAFKKGGVTTMVGDWTRGDPAITRFLESRGRSGVPLYLFYPKGGGEPEEMPQILTPGALVALTGT